MLSVSLKETENIGSAPRHPSRSHIERSVLPYKTSEQTDRDSYGKTGFLASLKPAAALSQRRPHHVFHPGVTP
jgi:hypothetical protein